MIYPIVAYGDPLLRKKSRVLEQGEVDVKAIAENMFETMYKASGVGLAAPQVGLEFRIFVVDGTPMNEADEADEDFESDPGLVDFKKVFINPIILEEDGEEWGFEEGCLSIPGIRGEVYRPERVKIQYQDLEFKQHVEVYEGLAARIIQHEYDHLEGKLFTDYLPALKKQLIKKRLTNISKGIVDADYRMKFYNRR